MAQWWWTVDGWLLAAIFLAIAYGILLCLAASPPVAQRIGLEDYHFFKRQVLYMAPAIAILLGTSLLTPDQARRLALSVLVVAIGMVILTLGIGDEVKGARRWLSIGPVSIQSSEFVKPAFIVIAAWLFAEGIKRPDMPGSLLSLALFVTVATLLVLQPDYGQTVLLAMVWGLMLFLTGISWRWIGGLILSGIAGMTVAYFTVAHVAERINRFIDRDSGDTYQVDTALQSFAGGGLLGVGPGEGVTKRILPDAHSDFIFAVAGEELGLFACLLLLVLFAFMVLRPMRYAISRSDPFIRFATIGLAAQVGLQAMINMAVNVALLPAKGMTLPFISYGGSSLLSMAFAMGLVLCLTRRRPEAGAVLPRWGRVVPVGR